MIIDGQNFDDSLSLAKSYKGLGCAVINEALNCAKSYQPGFLIWSECYDSRLFLLGIGSAWRSSLEFWCELADLDVNYVISSCKKQDWYKDYLEKENLKKDGKLIVISEKSLTKYFAFKWRVLKDFECDKKKYTFGEIIYLNDPVLINILLKQNYIRKERTKKRG